MVLGVRRFFLWWLVMLLLSISLIVGLEVAHVGFVLYAIPSSGLSKLGRQGRLATNYNALIFRAGSSGDVYILDLERTSLDLVANNTDLELSMSPDGRMVAFDRDDRLFVIDLDTRESRQVTKERHRVIPVSWSSDGRRLAYIEAASSMLSDGILYVLDLDVWQATRVVPDNLSVPGFSAVGWFPDDYRVVFQAREKVSGYEKDGTGTGVDAIHYDLYLGNAQGDDLVNLTEGIGNVMDSSLSPDGQTILFSSDIENRAASEREGYYMHDFKVYVMNLERREPVEVMSLLMGQRELLLGWHGSPWSPDSKWVLLPPRIIRPDTLRAVEPDGTLYREIIHISSGPQTDAGISGFTVTLSPDGNIVAGGGRHEKGGSRCLCAVNSDGSHFRILVPNVHVIRLTWSPDSRSIFFQYAEGEDTIDYRYGIVNVDGSGFHDPFAHLTEDLGAIEDVHWVRLSLPPPTPTVTPSPPEATATAMPDGRICTAAAGIIVLAILAWWLARRG